MNKITKLGKDTYSHYDNDTGEIFVFRVETYGGTMGPVKFKAVKLDCGVPVAETEHYEHTSQRALFHSIQASCCAWNEKSSDGKTKDPHEGARKIWEAFKEKQDELITETFCNAYEKLISSESVKIQLLKCRIKNLRTKIAEKDKKIKTLESEISSSKTRIKNSVCSEAYVKNSFEELREKFDELCETVLKW